MRVFTILLLLLTLSACGDDDKIVGPEPPQDPFPLVSKGDAGRDLAIDQLADSYVELDIDRYDALLHEYYVFYPGPVARRDVPRPSLSRAEDYASTRAMFSRQEGIRPELDESGVPTGQFVTVPPVATIQMRFTPVSGSQWEYTVGLDQVGRWVRPYRIDSTVTFVGSDTIEQVVGMQRFSLAEGAYEVDGEILPVWQILEWEDMGVVARAASEARAISDLKSWY